MPLPEVAFEIFESPDLAETWDLLVVSTFSFFEIFDLADSIFKFI